MQAGWLTGKQIGRLYIQVARRGFSGSLAGSQQQAPRWLPLCVLLLLRLLPGS